MVVALQVLRLLLCVQDLFLACVHGAEQHLILIPQEIYDLCQEDIMNYVRIFLDFTFII